MLLQIKLTRVISKDGSNLGKFVEKKYDRQYLNCLLHLQSVISPNYGKLFSSQCQEFSSKVQPDLLASCGSWDQWRYKLALLVLLLIRKTVKDHIQLEDDRTYIHVCIDKVYGGQKNYLADITSANWRSGFRE